MKLEIPRRKRDMTGMRITNVQGKQRIIFNIPWKATVYDKHIKRLDDNDCIEIKQPGLFGGRYGISTF